MRSLISLSAILFLCLGCGGSDETAVDRSTTVMSETTATLAPVDTSATIVELPSETTQTAVATETAVATQTVPAVTPTPAAKTTTAPAKAATKPATKPAEASPEPVKPTPVPTPAPEPAPVAKAPEPEPAAPPAAKAPAPASKAPKTHTVDKGGVLHAPGMDTPATRCAACHGKDLKGGKIAPSCFSCHEQKWK